MEKLSNYINHYVLVIDESTSMYHLKDSVIKVVDGLTAHLAKISEDLNQETRLSVYAFASRGTARCLVWDIDVLRMPSINGMYKPSGMTALADCTILAVNDLKTVPQKYGDHSFVMYVVTDGQENDSRNRFQLRPTLDGLPENWTFGVFVPDQKGVTYAKSFGFPANNIQIWDTTSVEGIETVGAAMRSTSTHLMQQRKAGVRGTKSLFTLNQLSTTDIKAKLTPLPTTDYYLLPVGETGRIDDFVNGALGRPYQLGEAFYELTKTETIQPQKSIAVLYQGRVYVGHAARSLLGLPNEHVKVKPADYSNYRIFVQSTSLNRKLISGTNLLVFKQHARVLSSY